MSWRFWRGETLKGQLISFDTETVASDNLDLIIPELVLFSAYDGQQSYIGKREQLAEFLLLHQDREFVGHNITFDHWVLDQWLREDFSLILAGDYKKMQALKVWWDIVGEGRAHDTMLLDSLVRIARGDGEVGGRGCDRRALDSVAEEYASGVPTPDKESPYRLTFHTLLGACWDWVDPGYFDYAALDAVASWHSYQTLLYEAKALELRYLSHKRPDRFRIFPGAPYKWGWLTETIQVQGAIALAAQTRLGVVFDRERAAEMEAKLRSELQGHWDFLLENYPEIFKWKKDGSYEVTKKGQMPALKWKKAIQPILRKISEDKGLPLPISTGKTRQISKAEDDWDAYSYKDEQGKKQYVHPFLGHWIGPAGKKKLLEFFAVFRNQKDGRIHAKYNTLLKTGRTSITRNRLQQMPRDADFRSLFVASPGYLLVTADFKFIELVTLAATCQAQLGYSVLGDVIRAGRDPHAFTAAMVNGIPYEEFLSWEQSDPKRYKKDRQAAKAINFGVPGGLGAKNLVAYAAANYNVPMTLEEARALREKLIYEIYHELSDRNGYLASTYLEDIGASLQLDPQLVEQHISSCFKTLRPGRVAYLLGRVLRQLPFTAEGEAYDDEIVAKCKACLKGLFLLARRPELWLRFCQVGREEDPELKIKKGSALLLDVFGRTGCTLTGRLRGRTDFCNSRNYCFQALAADGGKLAMFELCKRGKRVILFCHDELLVEVPEATAQEEMREIEQVMAEKMSEVVGGDLPIGVECHLGKCWEK